MELNINIKADNIKEFDHLIEHLGKLSMEIQENKPDIQKDKIQEPKEGIRDFMSRHTGSRVEQEPQPKTHKNAWTPEEDTKLLELVKKYPARGRWAKIAEEMGKKYHQVFTRYKYLSKPKKSKKKPLFKRNGALDEKQEE